MTNYIPRHEEISGSDLTGSSGTANRTYILSNDNAILAQMQVLVSEAILQTPTNFTFDSDTNTITFLGPVWDNQPITIDYFTLNTTTVGSYYTNTLGIVRAAGIGVEIFNENLGTGDSSTTSFDINNGNVIDQSYSLYFGASGSNSFTPMTETTHYTILKDKGLIELTVAGVALLSTNILYIDYVYSPRHSDTLLASYLPAATSEVEKITGNYWGTAKTSYQYFDGYTSGYPQTDAPFGEQIEPYPEYELKYKGINSITSVITIDRQGNTDRTLDTDEYRIFTDDEYQESRLLLNTTIPNGKANVKVTFISGYTTVPDLVQELTSLVGGLMALINISGGSYKDVSTYSIGRKSFSIGQIYVNVKESITQMKTRMDVITNELGGNFDCV